MPFSNSWLGSCLLLAAAAARGQALPAAPADSARPSRPYTYTEQLPVFPPQEAADSARTSQQRVIRFLNKDLHFPAKALRDGVQGKVYFKFVVDAQGHTTSIQLARGLRADVDAEVLRDARRLEAIQWRPGTQNGRPVAVAFTVPITFSVQGGRPGAAQGDSLDLPRFSGFKLPTSTWNLAKAPPANRAVLYGTCLQRLGAGSGGIGQYVRVVNLSTGQVFRFNVKPALRGRRENSFCYALPAGRYALSQYEFNHSNLVLDFRAERLLKPSPRAQSAPGVAATRYVFTLLPGQLHYVGTWNFANENEPIFLNEKELLDPSLQADYPAALLPTARLAMPQ